MSVDVCRDGRRARDSNAVCICSPRGGVNFIVKQIDKAE